MPGTETSPIYGLSIWAGAQSSPWLVENTVQRAFEALHRGSVADRDLTAPPGSCADGAAYLVGASATGAWTGEDGKMAVAVGTDAANGWIFLPVAIEGALLWVDDENVRIQYEGAVWVALSSGSRVPVVRAATTAAITLSTDLESGDSIDGVTLQTGDRVLVKNQASGSENGIYIVPASGAPNRATDADSSDDLVNYACFVSEGTTNADKLFQCTTNAPITVDTTALTFVEFTSGGGSSAPDLSWKASVRAATTAAGTLATDFEDGDSLDGVALATGDRILIKNQADASENGIYAVAASGAPTRVADVDDGTEMLAAAVVVEEGTVNAGTAWTCSTPATIVVDTTDLEFVRVLAGLIGEGTAFPASPSTGQRFYRTDRKIEYFYDGTRWLSTHLYFERLTANADSIGSATAYRSNPPGNGLYDIFIENYHLVSRLTNSSTSSNYFTSQLSYTDSGGDTALGAGFSTQNDAQNTWVSRQETIGVALTSPLQMFTSIIEVGAAGGIFLPSFSFRLIG